MPRENLLSLLRDFERFRNNIAVVQQRGYRREAWTYGRLAAEARNVAILLKARGVNTGERVLLWAPNSAEWVAAFWGCLMRGAVAVPMDDGASLDFVSRVARDAAVKLVFTTAERARPKPEIFDPLVPTVDMEVLFAESMGPQSVAANGKGGIDCATLSDVPLTRTHIAEILFTSGTTSEPRGVVLTHGNFLANLEPLEKGIAAYSKYERWFHPLRLVTLVPLSHVFGQFMALFVPPLLGAGIVFEPSAGSGEIIRSIKRERAVALVAVPRMIESLRNALEGEMEARDRNWLARTWKAAEGKKFLRRAWIFRRIHRRFGWKFWAFISGGAALGDREEEFFKRAGFAVVQGYGMTETASLISLNHPFRATEGSIGKILPGREFRLAEDGEILVRGENVSAGYWKSGEVQRSESNEWLHTGDIGEMDAAGNLHFRGRKKNVMVTAAGLNIYPEDLESALRKQPAVRDCVVLPVNRDGNAQPFAALLLANGQTEDTAKAVIAGANANLAEYQRIRDWLVWTDADFPRTATGKPRLAEISARAHEFISGAGASDDTDRSAANSSAGDGLDQLVRRFTGRQVERRSLEGDLNLTSLDRVELMSTLEAKFQVELDETSFSNARTVGDIQALLREPAAKHSEYNYPRWAQSGPVHLLRLAIYYLLVWPATLLLAHPRVVGRENLAFVRGPVLVISNHVTRRSDIGLILAALPRRYRHNLATAMGGETLRQMRRPPREWFPAKRWAYQLGYWLVTALFNVFPLPQRSGFRESFRFAGESVDRGYSLLVFPEGEITQNGNMTRFQSGIGLLAENLGLPIVPMRLDGVWQMKTAHRRLARIGEVTVRIGTPVRFPAGTNPETVAQSLERLVRAL
jgi:long-chain acyl-CoA synthetase